MSKYTADSLKVCRLADIAHLMNNLEAQRNELLAALREIEAKALSAHLNAKPQNAGLFRDMAGVARAAIAKAEESSK